MITLHKMERKEIKIEKEKEKSHEKIIQLITKNILIKKKAIKE